MNNKNYRFDTKTIHGGSAGKNLENAMEVANYPGLEGFLKVMI